MVTKVFNRLLEEVEVELKKAPEKIFHEKIEEYFIANPIAYSTYLLVKTAYVEEEIVDYDILPNLSTNKVILGILIRNRFGVEEVITGLEIFKYELTYFPVYSIVGNDPTDFIKEIDSYIKNDLAEYVEAYEDYLKLVEKQNKEAELFEEEGVVNIG